ncbi:WD40/YVTN/BNR-like repeat-containing protein [Caldimonas brevitalea]|uniref:WD40/YVTN/BNR-like repeat-containing protein n=1 Tax=Caldimonas brevitalea TaxID=413882 RepID=UPI0012F9F5F0|nr:hypothetical protein [Caldimonas brevitalea]
MTAVVLVGCAAPAAKRGPDGLALDLKAEGSDGFVVLKVVSTRPVSLLNPKWQNIAVRSTGGQNDELRDLTPPYSMLGANYVPTESLYFARLKAGEYEVSSLGSTGAGPGLLLALMMSDHASMQKRLPRFNVETGRLTNLGTIVYAPELDKDQPADIVLLSGPVGQRAALQDLRDEGGTAALPPLGGGWGAPPEESAESLKRAREMVSMVSHRGSAISGGTFIGGSHLGQILMRTGPRTWVRESLDTLNRVVFATRLADGTLVAGMEYGRYQIKRPGGTWEAHKIGSEKGRVVYIEPRADGSALFVAGDAKTTRVWLKRGGLDHASDEITQVAAFGTPPDLLLTLPDALIVAWNETGILRQSVHHRIDKNTLKLTTYKESFWVVDWQYRVDGSVALTRQNGMSGYRSVSLDGARTWITANEPGYLGGFWLDANKGYAFGVSPGFSTVDSLLQVTSDGGKTWQRQGGPLVAPSVGQLLQVDGQELVALAGHVVYSSIDQGGTWQRVFPVPQAGR